MVRAVGEHDAIGVDRVKPRHHVAEPRCGGDEALDVLLAGRGIVDVERRLCAVAPIPVYALGAVTPDRAAAVKRAGACGMAVIGAIVDAADPAQAVRDFLAAWGG